MDKRSLKEHLSELEGSGKTLTTLSFVTGLIFCVSIILGLTLLNMIIYKSILNAVVFGVSLLFLVFINKLGNYLSNKYVKEIELERDLDG